MTVRRRHPSGSAASSAPAAALILLLLLASAFRGSAAMPGGHDDTAMFAPLSCNANVMHEPCAPWSARFGPSALFGEQVEIPCGECVILDPLAPEYASLSSLELTLDEGLSVVGRLLIPNVGDPAATKVTLNTKSVEVQGVLSVYESVDGPSTTGKVAASGAANLVFHLFGAEFGERALLPHEENGGACPAEGCNVGKLPFAIAGGRLDVHAMPKATTDAGEVVDCPTWTDLIELGTGGAPAPEDYPVAPSLPSGCSDHTVMSFDGGSNDWLDFWDASNSNVPTVSVDPSDNSLRIAGRTKSNQGPRAKIYAPSTTTEPCQQLQADVPYLLSAKIKVSALEGYGPSLMETTGKQLHLQLQKVGRYNKSVYRTIELSKYYPKVADGEYFEFRTVFDVTQAELDDVNSYNGAFYLLFVGMPAPGYDVNVAEMQFSLASEEAYPNPSNVCGNLIANGGFEGGEYYPWKPRSGGSFLVEEEDGNAFLRHAGRTPVYPGLEQTLVAECLEPDLLYEFSMRARVDTVAGGSFVLKWVITDPSGSVKYRDFFRPPKQYASDGWVTHTLAFLVTQEMADAVDVKLITMVGEGSPAAVVDYDDIKIEFKEGVGQELLVDSPLVAQCWSKGELLITPSTNQYDDSRVVDIVDVSSKTHNGKEVGVIKFEGDAGFHPFFEYADERMRAEVALLSRNVLVTATPDPANALNGGHLIVLHTPSVQQHLEGVQFRGMGQQGNLGRYPIHFHLSHNVSGSVIKSNAILESNQRCIVIHGSNEALIEANVAYDTNGHCFMTEDGNEFGNVFRGNLGALTLPVETANLLSAVDSDHNPSTYWMPGPRNSHIGNVAAGSKGSGYWFEVEGFFRGAAQHAPEVLDGTLPIPSRENLAPYVFESNKAHSNEGNGMMTYPSGGWKPPNEAIFSNFVSYRNRGAGAFSHNGLNQTFIGGLYSDNQYVGIDIDRSYRGRIEEATIIGYSAEYEALVMSPSNQGGIQALSPCGYNNRVQRGIQLHAGKTGQSNNVGYHISNVRFNRYGSVTGCYDSAALDVDSREDSGYFDPRASFESNQYVDVDEASRINLCDSDAGGIDYIHIRTDGGGYIVSDNSLWTTFPSGCSPLAGGGACAQICTGSCVRSLKVSVPSASTPTATRLKVVDTSTGKSIDVSGEWSGHMGSHAEFYTLTAHYRLYLPVGGSYVASFFDSESNSAIWPTYVDTIYEDTGPDGCDGAQLNFAYDGSGDPEECDQLLRTGYGAWLHSGGGVHNITDADGWYLENRERDGWSNGLLQYLDTRCFEAGAMYRFTAKLMLADENGNSLDCDPSDRKCPIFRMNSSGGPPGTTTSYNEFFEFSTWTPLDWNSVDAAITISEEEAAKSKSSIYIYGAENAWAMRIRDVKLERIDVGLTAQR